jgi:hypothetical protein
VTAERVSVGISSQVGYPAGQCAGVMALDRGRVALALRVPRCREGRLRLPRLAGARRRARFVSGLDGRLYALRL